MSKSRLMNIFSGPYIGEVKLTFFLSSNYLEFEIVAARGLQLVHQIEPGQSTIAKGGLQSIKTSFQIVISWHVYRVRSLAKGFVRVSAFRPFLLGG